MSVSQAVKPISTPLFLVFMIGLGVIISSVAEWETGFEYNDAAEKSGSGRLAYV